MGIDPLMMRLRNARRPRYHADEVVCGKLRPYGND